VAKRQIRANQASSPEISGQESLPVSNSADIAVLAYRLWQDRGCPQGSPEADWFRAEELLRDGLEMVGSPVREPLVRRGKSA
jgi:hypothetical protein